MASDTESVHSARSKGEASVSSNESLDLNEFIKQSQDPVEEREPSPEPVQEPVQEPEPEPIQMLEMTGGGSKNMKREKLKGSKREKLKEGKRKKEKRVEEPTIPEPEPESKESETETKIILDELREHMEATPSITDSTIGKVHSYFRLDKFDQMLDQYPSYIKTGIFSTVIFVIAIILITLFELATFALSKKKVIKVKMISDKGYLYDDENQMYLLYNPRIFSPLAILGYSNINDRTISQLKEDQLYEITVFSNSIKRIVVVEE